MIRNVFGAVVLGGLLGGVLFSSGAIAKPPAGISAVAQGPILDPRTGSYFELRIDNAAGGMRPEWRTANQRARSLSHQGRPGRLAVIADMETLDFIRDRFRVNRATWIGLRFFCQFRQLVWVTGDVHPINQRDFWAPRWYLSDQGTCNTSRVTYMPVFLTEERSGGVYWQATGPAKFFNSYLVEYPAPARADPEQSAAETPAERQN